MEKHLKFTTLAEFVTEASQHNPDLGWLEFVLTDSKPNANKQGIPAEAFSRLVETGLYMPVKIAEDGIRMDHSNALPLGPITKLESNAEQVKGKAAIWKRERPNIYSLLKDMRDEGEAINISWELAYTQSSEDENGVTWLQDPRLLAATVVGNPAYGGRTQVFSMASEDVLDAIMQKVSKGQELAKEEIEQLSTAISKNQDQEGREAGLNGDEKTMEELEKLKEEYSELQEKYDSLATNLEEVQVEHDDLLQYKEEKEEAERRETVLSNRISALKEAGIEVTEDDVEEKAEIWLSMSDDGFASLVEMVSEVKSSSASSNNGIPDVSGDAASVKDIVRKGLQELREKK